ncbi:MAG: lipid-A-disaccharide synthase, partial [Victivallaceae bacterium]|nr:lipid-A-disaccharide synthase [Victivallaceae bacterium]
MIASGIPVKIDSTELGVVGIFEVVKMLATFIKLLRRMIRLAAEERPDAVILIDYPGFNLRFAKAVHKLGIKVIWYVSPQVWVWGKKRLPVLTKICSEIMVIFPFEADFYREKADYPAKFVGHPLLDIIDERAAAMPDVVRDPKLFLLLPGSRKSELTRLLKPMLQSVVILAKRHPELVFHLAAPRQKVADFCRRELEKFSARHAEMPPGELAGGDTGYWLRKAGTGLAASGTVTVEAAISGIPLVVGYKLNFFTLLIAAVLVKLYRGFFVMPNIIADKEIYKELLQWRFAPSRIVPEVEAILPGGARRAEIEADLARIRKLLASASGDASRQAAQVCMDSITAKE